MSGYVSKAAEENLLLAGRVDEDEVLPHDSQKVALEAAVERYIGVLKESYAQKLKNSLISFCHYKTWLTLITDYFNRI